MLINAPDCRPKPEVKFISYSGKYPNLCSGRLVLEINKKRYKFGHYKFSFSERNDEQLYSPFWQSGGYLDEDYNPVESPWIIDYERLPEELKVYAYEIDKVFNENVPHGCCGGCA